MTKTKPSEYPSYETEVVACDTSFHDMLRKLKGQKGYAVDLAWIQKAYDKAKELHGDTRRHSGVLYLRHPLAVAMTLAKLRCKTSVIAAGLLHDTLEDCEYTYEQMRGDFSFEIADIVEAVTAVKKEEQSMENVSPEYQHQFLDLLTDAKLIKSYVQREALLVRMADREHNLATLEACSPEKRRQKVEQTMQFLIPAAKLLGIRYFEVTLNNYCMKHEDLIADERLGVMLAEGQSAKCSYGSIVSDKNEITKASGYAYGQFDDILAAAMCQDSFFEYPEYNPFARMRGAGNRYVPERRRLVGPYEIAKQLPVGQNEFQRQDVYLNEFILTYKESLGQNPLSQFLRIHKAYLEPYGICFQVLPSDDEKEIRLLLTDLMENNYCFRLLPEEYLMDYFLGDSKPLAGGGRGWAKDATRPKIPLVYSYSDYKGLKKYADEIPRGATALDFAFAISTSLALTVREVKIKRYIKDSAISFSDSDHSYPLGTPLHEGDVVHFVADYFPDHKRDIDNAKIEWFSDITTETARRALIEHFKAKMGS